MKTLKINKISAVLVAALFVGSFAWGQQRAQYTQYMYNTMPLNAGYTGTIDGLEATAIHRSQWVGMDGAPVTTGLSLNGAINKHFGLGLTAVNDRIGPITQNELAVNLASSVQLNDKLRLSLGVSGGINSVSADWSMGTIYNTSDNAYNQNLNNEITPAVGAGLYLYSNRFYAGVSSPNVIKRKSNLSQVYDRFANELHFFVITGYVFDLSPNVKFKPALMTKIVPNAPLSIDLSANFLLKEQFTLGAAYRYQDAINLLAGYEFAKSFFVGYAYDLGITPTKDFHSGSHEIILKYKLLRQTRVATSPRFF
ncbi:type IX secretion system membrane protein PorP/SprF [Lishizhenia sp.]|uniref:PorP/SprF family type IX secretion system membrane protein n=1 Tax=Lishizhenia sp. TaxID=2497594 RepID=UPI00299D7F51|nr:type IX secretion system membrane protein PorP/SprF [Lishizhenia sp.]MDX1445478.1 type IX secretion system membrane protein PorP/SprF [Lishizhenia sp.]